MNEKYLIKFTYRQNDLLTGNYRKGFSFQGSPWHYQMPLLIIPCIS